MLLGLTSFCLFRLFYASNSLLAHHCSFYFIPSFEHNVFLTNVCYNHYLSNDLWVEVSGLPGNIWSFLSMLSGLNGMRMEISSYSAPLHGLCLLQDCWEACGSNCCSITQSLGHLILFPFYVWSFIIWLLFSSMWSKFSLPIQGHISSIWWAVHFHNLVLILEFFLENVLSIFSLPFKFLMP